MLTVKGLEGSTDLPTTRAGITARLRHGVSERILLHPREHGIQSEEVRWSDLDCWRRQAGEALAGAGPLADALRWNVAAYLWFAGAHDTLVAALDQSEALLKARAGLALLAAMP